MTGKVLGNRYRLESRIGLGGMAAVYAAEDMNLSRSVAVKVMLPQYAESPDFSERFHQEAKAAASLQNAHIVSIYDWGRDGEDYYIVMELLPGHDMRTLIKNEAPLDTNRIRRIGEQVCRALSTAHAKGVVHRDIAPQNIMILPDDTVKVMDFGIAKVAGSDMTRTSTVLGTAHYLSPEQAQGKRLTFASDLYSLGAVLYEAAVGQPVFIGPDPISVALQHVSADPVPLRSLNPSVDAALEAIIMKALAKDPDKRFQSTDAMRRALEGKDPLSENPAGGAGCDAQGAGTDEQTAALPVEQPKSEGTQVLPRQIASAPNTTLVMPSLSSDKILKVSTGAIPEQPEKKRRWPAAAAILIMGLILSAVAVYAIKPWEPANLATTGEEPTVALNQETAQQADAEQNPSEREEISDELSDANIPQSDDNPIDQTASSLPSREDLENFLIMEEAYHQVSHYNAAITQIAENFNAHYLDTLEQRQEYARHASSVAQSISDQHAMLSDLRMNVSLDFPWYNFFLDVQELYECLKHRIDAIVDAWNISLSYRSPGEHSSEILEPLNRDKDDTGSNLYLARFNEIYPLIIPPSLVSNNATESHIENSFFSIDLPESWIGKVAVIYEGSTVTVRPKEDASENGALFTAEIINADMEESQGDIGNSMYYSPSNNIGKKIRCNVPNYPFLALAQIHGGSPSTTNLSDDLLDIYVKLQTNGEQDLNAIADMPDESAVGTCAFDYFENTIMPTVQMRQL